MTSAKLMASSIPGNALSKSETTVLLMLITSEENKDNVKYKHKMMISLLMQKTYLVQNIHQVIQITLHLDLFPKIDWKYF